MDSDVIRNYFKSRKKCLMLHRLVCLHSNNIYTAIRFSDIFLDINMGARFTISNSLVADTRISKEPWRVSEYKVSFWQSPKTKSVLNSCDYTSSWLKRFHVQELNTANEKGLQCAISKYRVTKTSFCLSGKQFGIAKSQFNHALQTVCQLFSNRGRKPTLTTTEEELTSNAVLNVSSKVTSISREWAKTLIMCFVQRLQHHTRNKLAIEMKRTWWLFHPQVFQTSQTHHSEETKTPLKDACWRFVTTWSRRKLCFPSVIIQKVLNLFAGTYI